MALTPKLVTRNTIVLAAAMFAGFLLTIWVIVEFAPGHQIPPPAEMPAVETPQPAPHHSQRLTGPFSPDDAPADPGLCHWTAGQIFNHYASMFAPMADEIDVAEHRGAITGLVEAYLDLRCPAAIHAGDWHVTAEILGVGVLYESLRGDADFDPRAVHMVPLATETFEVLAPTRMCKEAVRGHDELYLPCLGTFERR